MKNFILNPKKLIPVLIVALFFGILVLAGFFIYKDYGVSGNCRGELPGVEKEGDRNTEVTQALGKRMFLGLEQE